MASASITRRGVKYVVRYRLGGRAYPVQHGGSFPTLRDADTRRKVINGELAAGRNPRVLLDSLAAATARTRFADVAERYVDSRIDLEAVTQGTLRKHLVTINARFAGDDPYAISKADIQTWVAASPLKPSTLRKYVATLRGVFAYLEIEPNPAVGLRLPKQDHVEINPPSAGEVKLIIEGVAPRHRLAVQFLEGSGLRVGELCALGWDAVDQAHGRIKVKDGKTAAARRWVPIPASLLTDVLEATPPDDRRGRVFPVATPAALNTTVNRACKTAGITIYSPHDLRHRYISLLVAQGVPITTVSAQVGHTSKSLTLDTYSHVLLDD